MNKLLFLTKEMLEPEHITVLREIGRVIGV